MKTALTAIALLIALPAAAQEGYRYGVSADIGLGVSSEPKFEGSNANSAAPWLLWKNTELTWPGHQAGAVSGGLVIIPSFGYVGERDGDTDDRLKGLDEVDASLELGGRIAYAVGPVTAYAALRKGVTGHEGLIGEAGADYRTIVNDRLILWSGANVTYADDDYMSSYFGVSPAESAASGLAAFDASGGIKSAGVRVQARYSLTEKTALLGEIQYDRLVNDAADSPVTLDKDQFAVRFGIVRRFNFGF